MGADRAGCRRTNRPTQEDRTTREHNRRAKEGGGVETSNKGKIIRSISKFAEQWGKDESELDELDTTILSLVNDYPGLNIHQVYRLIRDKKIFKEIHSSTIYYRTNSLEASGYLETKKGERNERRCYALNSEDRFNLKFIGLNHAKTDR